MSSEKNIVVRDDFIPGELQQQLSELVTRPIWRYGWHSNRRQDRYCFWHAHFAGGDGNSRRDCSEELRQRTDMAPVLQLWEFLAGDILRGHQPLRVYANSHTYGVEGYLHTDNSDDENYFTTVYYAHPVWRSNWSGELLFYSADREEIIKAVYPRPGRLVSFHGATPHCAHAPSRECPELRVSIVIKTQLPDPVHADA